MPDSDIGCAASRHFGVGRRGRGGREQGVSGSLSRLFQTFARECLVLGWEQAFVCLLCVVLRLGRGICLESSVLSLETGICLEKVVLRVGMCAAGHQGGVAGRLAHHAAHPGHSTQPLISCSRLHVSVREGCVVVLRQQSTRLRTACVGWRCWARAETGVWCAARTCSSLRPLTASTPCSPSDASRARFPIALSPSHHSLPGSDAVLCCYRVSV